jgi:hypothetical protein
MALEDRDWSRNDPPKGSATVSVATSRGPGRRSCVYWLVLAAIAAVVVAMWQAWIPGRSLLDRAHVDNRRKS